MVKRKGDVRECWSIAMVLGSTCRETAPRPVQLGRIGPGIGAHSRHVHSNWGLSATLRADAHLAVAFRA